MDIKVLFVCLGNICRSPLAEGIFRYKVSQKGLQVYCDSAGTNGFHVGELPDRRSRQIAQQKGIQLTHHARNLTKSDFMDFDYIIGMDKNNMNNIGVIASTVKQPKAKTYLMRSFEGSFQDVQDPYYGDFEAFKECYEVLDKAMDAFITFLEQEHQTLNP